MNLDFVHLFHHIVYIIPHDQLLFFDHSFFHSILFFILSYLSYPWWYSSFEVDLPLSEALSSVMVSLTLGASDSCLLNCHHLFFRTSLILLFLQEVVQDLIPTIQMHQLHGQNYFIKHMHNDKFLCIMQLFIQYNIHPYLIETFQMPSISIMTLMRLCTNPICQQGGFILNKQQWRVIQHHELLTHHMHISSIQSCKQSIMHNTSTKYNQM